MSEKPAEYLKRTCLICGCHTNQTINIYEPRSGPNIVQLIQAKFKFQPLNEDKYLCFSCNNWLINWHSLQALNSNDAESPSGTFRSHLNSMVQEKGASSSQQSVAVCRPIAQVRPCQLTTDAISRCSIKASIASIPLCEQQQANTTNITAAVSQTFKSTNFTKRSFRHRQLLTARPIQRKCMRSCNNCGRSIVIRSRSTITNMATAKKIYQNAKCSKCREISNWRKILLQFNRHAKFASAAVIPSHITKAQPTNLVKSSDIKRSLLSKKNKSVESHKPRIARVKPLHLCNTGRPQQKQTSTGNRQIIYTSSHSLQQPVVDGHLVARLSRLGTTLSRELIESDGETTTITRTPYTVAQNSFPASQKSLNTLSQMEADDILVQFNATIAEVLPTLIDTHNLRANKTGWNTNRKLTYQVSVTAYESDEVIDLSDE
ncbi:uncharacterized protein LOC119686171 [Teleopsis dalmanni]|uniref:uncharacterized protein LOC119686171 n=1 Tax=Teleopsis dalmanni TaxID=139649 RepID=UPI0018CF836B|nr:uncharacterized protein LOC119686171 [Teleopsis dalmanni]